MVPPLGDEALKEKVRAILRELEEDSLKHEVLQQLKAASSRRASFFEQPALLLILGFLLTGVVGTWLASFWQSKEQQKLQDRLAREHSLQQKYEVAEQLNKAVAEAYTGAQVVLHVITYDQSTRMKEAAEREAYWTQSRRTWMVNSLMLQLKLTINYRNKEPSSLFQEIIDDGDELTVNVNEALVDLKSHQWKTLETPQIAEKRKTIRDLSNDMREKTIRLLRMLVYEVHEDELRD